MPFLVQCYGHGIGNATVSHQQFAPARFINLNSIIAFPCTHIKLLSKVFREIHSNDNEVTGTQSSSVATNNTKHQQYTVNINNPITFPCLPTKIS